MSIKELCNREVVIAERGDTVFSAAQLMRQYHVGDVVVVEKMDGKNIPVGIVTDRDVVVELVATELDSKVITVGDISVDTLATVNEDISVSDAIQYMCAKGVRRVPVVNNEGALVGIVALDDLLALIAEDLSAIAKLVEHEQARETKLRH